jgi:hypothetical protein
MSGNIDTGKSVLSNTHNHMEELGMCRTTNDFVWKYELIY